MSLHKRFIDLSTPLEQISTETAPKLNPLQNIRLISYDFYGTLFISGVGDIGVDDGIVDVGMFDTLLKNSGISVISEQAASECLIIYNNYVNEFISSNKKKGIEYPEPDIRGIWQSVLTSLRNSKFIEYQDSSKLYERISVEFEARINPVWPMPGAVKTLLNFQAKGFLQGIISNSQFYTPIVLEALTGYSLQELGFSEELLHWSFEEKMKKPGLKFYENYIRKVQTAVPGIAPESILYIGNDMLKDIYPAHTLGMKTALFAGDNRSLKWRKDDKRCRNLEPDLIITEFEQLTDAVQS